MNVNLEVLENIEKLTYTVLNLDNGDYTSLQRNAANGISNTFPGVFKRFNTREEITQYIKEVKKTIKDKNAN